MTDRLFIGGPWHGREYDVPDTHSHWNVLDLERQADPFIDWTTYTRVPVGAVIDGKRPGRYLFVHKSLLGNPAAMERQFYMVLVSRWVEAAPDVTE